MSDIKNLNAIGNDDSLTVKNILETVKSLISTFRKNFFVLLIIGLLGSGFGFYLAYKDIPTYPAKVKFIMKESGGTSSLMNSLGSLGSLIGGSSAMASPLDRTLAILGSERIIGSVLLKSIVVNKKKDLVINHIINSFALKNKWQRDTSLNSVSFSLNDVNLLFFNSKQKKAYKNIVGMLSNERSTILLRSFDKLTGVFDVSFVTPSEELSIETTKLFYNQLELFIYEQSVTTSGRNIGILNAKLDSIKTELNIVQGVLARNTDRTLGLLMQEDKIEQKRLMMKEQMLTLMYGEAQKNLEAFKFVNESINAGLEVLESPLSPVAPISKSKIKFSAIGFLLSSFIGFVVLYTVHSIRSQL